MGKSRAEALVLVFGVLAGCSTILGIEEPERWDEPDASTGGGTSGTGGTGGSVAGSAGGGGTGGTAGTGAAAGDAGTAGQAGTGGTAGGGGQAGSGGAAGAAGAAGSGGASGAAGAAGSGTCGPTQKWCDETCVQIADPQYGCTDTNCTACSLPHATATCATQACSIAACDSTFADCNEVATDGCETLLSSGVAVRCEGKLYQTCSAGNPWSDVNCSVGCDLSAGGCLTVVGIAAGGNHTCAVLSNGRLKCWGDNSNGQLGNTGAGSSSAHPVDVPNLADVAKVSLGFSSTCVVAAGGLKCWGANSAGQLGDGTTVPRSSPPASPVLSGVLDVDAGPFTSACVRMQAGGIRCFGTALNGTSTPVLTPTEVSGVDDALLAVASYSACAGGPGSLKCWGDNGVGQLGDDNAPTDSAAAVDVTPSLPWAGLGAGDLSIYAFTTDANVYAWGGNGSGQLGIQATGDAHVPSPVVLPIPVDAIRQVDGGFRHACLLAVKAGTSEHALMCFGNNAAGQLGQGSTGGSSSTPVVVPDPVGSGDLDAESRAVGWEHTCVIERGGEGVLCWGSNSKGQLGSSGQTESGTPIPVEF